MPGCGWHGSSVLESQPEDLDDVAELLGDCGASLGAPTAADAPPPHQLMSSCGKREERRKGLRLFTIDPSLDLALFLVCPDHAW